jgi:hypothetical protein
MDQERKDPKRASASHPRAGVKNSLGRTRAGDPNATSILRHVGEDMLGTMLPGDIILLADSECLRQAVESVCFALLACPQCGTLGLVTAAQYGGNVPVTCASNQCSGRFLIREQSRLTLLGAELPRR